MGPKGLAGWLAIRFVPQNTKNKIRATSNQQSNRLICSVNHLIHGINRLILCIIRLINGWEPNNAINEPINAIA